MDNYFIENKETGKIELHFDKESYMALSEEQKREVKGNFLFSRVSKAWVSRRKFPNLYYPREVAKKLGLEDGGTTGEKLSFAEQMQVKAEKAENRADRYEYKAMKAHEKGEQMQKPIHDMNGDVAFFTQPNINNSAGRAFTKRRERMWDSFMGGFEQFRKSEYYKERAETARMATEKPSISFCQRRIDDANTSIRKLNRNIEEYEDYLKQIEAGVSEIKDKKYGWKVNVTKESCESNIERWEEMREDAISKIAYYDALIEEQGGIFPKEKINKGSLIKSKRWGVLKVLRKNPKSITCEFTTPNMTYADGSFMQCKISYADVIGIVE